MDNREEMEKSGNMKPKEKLSSSTESCGFFNGTLNYLQSYHQTLQLAQKLSNVVKAPHHFNPRGLPSACITPFSHADIKQKYTIPKKSDTMLNLLTDNPNQSINAKVQLRQRLKYREIIACGRTNIENEGKINKMDPVLLDKNLAQNPMQIVVERNDVKFQNHKKNENFSRSRRKRILGSHARDKSRNSFEQSGNANERFRIPCESSITSNESSITPCESSITSNESSITSNESSITSNESSSIANESFTSSIERSRGSIERFRNSVERSTIPNNQHFNNKSFSHERFFDRHGSKNKSLSQMCNKSTVIRRRVTNQYDARNSRDRFGKPNVKYESRNRHLSTNSERSTARLKTRETYNFKDKPIDNCHKFEERSSKSRTYGRCDEIFKTTKNNNKGPRKNDKNLDKADIRANGQCKNIINGLKSSESTQEETIKLLQLNQSGKIDSTSSKLLETPPKMCSDELQKVAICKLCPKTFRNKAFLSYHERVHYQNDRLSPSHRADGLNGSVLEEINVEVVSQNQELTINTHGSHENKLRINNGITTCTNPHDSLLADFLKQPKSVNAIEEEGISVKLLDKNAAVVPTNESLFLKTPSKEDSLHKCSICQKCFKRKCSLVNHERSHLIKSDTEKQSEENSPTELRADGQFVCQICLRKFARKCNLAVHSVSHKNAKEKFLKHKSSCNKNFYNILDKSFVARIILSRRRRQLQKEKPNKCLECGKRFRKLEKFKKHQQIHSRELNRYYKCRLCGTFFSQLSELKDHKLEHKSDMDVTSQKGSNAYTHPATIWEPILSYTENSNLSLPNVQIKVEPSDNVEHLVDETPHHFNFQKQYSNFLESVLPCSDNIKVENAGAINQSDEDPIRRWIIPFTNFELIKSIKRTKPFSFYNVHQEPVNLNNIYLDVLEISARSNGPIECKVPASSLKELTKKMTVKIQDIKYII